MNKEQYEKQINFFKHRCYQVARATVENCVGDYNDKVTDMVADLVINYEQQIQKLQEENEHLKSKLAPYVFYEEINKVNISSDCKIFSMLETSDYKFIVQSQTIDGYLSCRAFGDSKQEAIDKAYGWLLKNTLKDK